MQAYIPRFVTLTSPRIWASRSPFSSMIAGVMYLEQIARCFLILIHPIPYQFDSLIHFDKITAVQPLVVNAEWKLKFIII